MSSVELPVPASGRSFVAFCTSRVLVVEYIILSIYIHCRSVRYKSIYTTRYIVLGFLHVFTCTVLHALHLLHEYIFTLSNFTSRSSTYLFVECQSTSLQFCRILKFYLLVLYIVHFTFCIYLHWSSFTDSVDRTWLQYIFYRFSFFVFLPACFLPFLSFFSSFILHIFIVFSSYHHRSALFLPSIVHFAVTYRFRCISVDRWSCQSSASSFCQPLSIIASSDFEHSSRFLLHCRSFCRSFLFCRSLSIVVELR